MAHYKGDIEAGQTLRFRHQARYFLRRQAEARHAGIDLQNRVFRCASTCMGVPELDLAEIVENRREAMAKKFLRLARLGAEKNRNPAVRQEGAQFDALVERGGEEFAAPRVMESRRHRCQPQSISIRFDHRAGVCASFEACSEGAPVGCDGVEVDAELGARKGVRRHLVDKI